MPRYRIYPYKQGSRSARALADALGGRVLRLEGSRFIPRRDDVIINWGSTTCPFTNRLNSSTALVQATNKLFFFQQMSDVGGVSIPRFWTRQEDIPDDAFPIVCRTILNGHSGRGIVIADDRGGLVRAPLYVQYVKKQDEYRVHVVNNQSIIIQRKARRRETPDDQVNWQVRNLDGGFVFVLCDPNDVPPCVVQQACDAVRALGLDFGAADVIYNQRSNTAYVLEVNCAPGLEERTAQAYAAAFRAQP